LDEDLESAVEQITFNIQGLISMLALCSRLVVLKQSVAFL
jgi:hypothetical protein